MQIFSPTDLFSGGGIDPAAPLRTRLWRGVRGGVLGAAGLTAFALLIVALARPEPGDLPGPLWAFIVLYFAGGIIGGAVYGGLRPLLRSLPGTFLFVFALLSVVLALLFLTIALVDDSFSISAFIIAVGAGALVLALVFTPGFWGRTKGAPWAGPVLVGVFLSALAIRGAGRYLELHPEAGFWIALLHQWPLLAPVGLIALAKLFAIRGRNRAV